MEWVQLKLKVEDFGWSCKTVLWINDLLPKLSTDEEESQGNACSMQKSNFIQ